MHGKFGKICDFCWKGGLKELKHRDAEMVVLGNCWESVKRAVLKAAHPRTPFQGEYSDPRPGVGEAGGRVPQRPENSIFKLSPHD